MATIGISIGLSFGVGIVVGPIIAHFGGVQTVFWATAALTVLAMLTLIWVVPNPNRLKLHRDAEFVPAQMFQALKNPDLLRLDYGIFILHMILMAIFVVIPTDMRNAGLAAGHEWQVYLPVFVLSMGLVVPFIILAEKKRKMKAVFLGAISVILLAELGLSQTAGSLPAIIACLGLFFCGFNLLEATLPSLVSKTAPADLKGTAMGAYSSCQFMGLFIGGLVGGWFKGAYGETAVFLFCAAAALSWLLVALRMTPPRYLANMLISLDGLDAAKASDLAAAMLAVSGVAEVTLSVDDGVAYLKVDSQVLDKAALQAVVAGA
jgi:predicted MFS family arabinose efflux permease